MKIVATVKNEIGDLRTTKQIAIELPDGTPSQIIEREVERLMRHTSGAEIVGDASEELVYHA